MITETEEITMRYSSFNWADRPAGHGGPKRGWIFGPWFGKTLTITWKR
jgi:hypothetical protein